MGEVVSVTPRPRFSPGERTPGTHCTRAWMGPRADLDAEARGIILSYLPGIEPRSPGRPARHTLYLLSYPAHSMTVGYKNHRLPYRTYSMTCQVKYGFTTPMSVLYILVYSMHYFVPRAKDHRLVMFVNSAMGIQRRSAGSERERERERESCSLRCSSSVLFNNYYYLGLSDRGGLRWNGLNYLES
jgi:hypothetical protein